MKRLLVAGLVALNLVALVAAFSAPAGATHSLPHLIRQVNRLESNVADLKRDVRSLRQDLNVVVFDLFVCTFPGDPLTTFTDGSQGYSLYYDPACLGSAAAKVGGVDTERVVRSLGK